MAAAASPIVIERKDRASAVNILLHPLVIINISEHWTRAKVHSKEANPRVIGVLLGLQTGRNVDISTSFEVVNKTTDAGTVLDTAYLQEKQGQMKKVFPTFEIVGWYCTGSGDPTARELDVHKQLLAYNEAPLFLQLDPVIQPKARELPVVLFESEVQVARDAAALVFVRGAYKIETGEAERIAVDHVAHARDDSAAGSRLATHLGTLRAAIAALAMRARLLAGFLEAVQRGTIPPDYPLLRQLASMTNQLPAIDTARFRQDFLTEYNDALLVAYLASITKTANNINELVDKYNLTYDRHGRRGRFF